MENLQTADADKKLLAHAQAGLPSMDLGDVANLLSAVLQRKIVPMPLIRAAVDRAAETTTPEADPGRALELLDQLLSLVGVPKLEGKIPNGAKCVDALVKHINKSRGVNKWQAKLIPGVNDRLKAMGAKPITNTKSFDGRTQMQTRAPLPNNTPRRPSVLDEPVME